MTVGLYFKKNSLEEHGESDGLSAAFREGSREAFEEIIAMYERPIFNLVLRLVRNREDAADVVQSVFLKAYEKRLSFKPEFKLFSWIYRIALNESLNFLRASQRFSGLDGMDFQGDATPESRFQDAEVAEFMQDAIMRLKPEHRVVIVLKHFQDCAYREIAELLDIPEKTVKSRLFTAREQLRIVLEEKGVK